MLLPSKRSDKSEWHAAAILECPDYREWRALQNGCIFAYIYVCIPFGGLRWQHNRLPSHWTLSFRSANSDARGQAASSPRSRTIRRVTVLRNGEPTYFIINAHDYRIYRQALIDAENRQARHEALNGIGKRFGSVDDLMADLDA